MEQNNNDGEINPKHHRRSWSDMAGGAPVEGNVTVSVPQPTSTHSTTIDLTVTYTGQLVRDML